MKTVKVLDITERIHIICIRVIDDNCNPYRLYLVYNARHEKYGYYTERKKQIAKYGNFESILCMIRDIYISGIQYQPINIIINWCKAYSSQ